MKWVRVQDTDATGPEPAATGSPVPRKTASTKTARTKWAWRRARKPRPRPRPSDGGGFGRRDLIHESLEGVGSRPSRLLITLLGTVLGIASLVATLGLAQTTAGQIAKSFDLLSATRVTVEPGKAQGRGGTEKLTAVIPWNAVERVADLAGVEDSFIYAPVEPAPEVLAVQVVDPAAAAVSPPPVVAVSSQMLQVVGGEISTGRFFDVGHDVRGDRVVVLGKNAAEKLGINRVSGQPAVFIAGSAYSVIGILESVGVRENLLNSAIVPIGVARAELGLSSIASLDIQVAVGAGQLVGRQAPIALDPNNPDAYKVKTPTVATGVKEQVASDINVLFVAIGVVALIGGGIGIANVTLLSVTERRGEIGLRRALGARTRQIAQQFMLESLTTGILGGLIGVAVGLFVVVGVCLVQGWTPVLAPWVPFGGVTIGAAVGLIAGTYPALKAARIEPVDALRSV